MDPTLWLPLALLVSTLATQPDGGRRISSEAVSPAPLVRDPVFAYLIALLRNDLYGTIDAATLERIVEGSSRKSALPYRRLRSLTRSGEGGGRASRVIASFDRPLRLPVPYRILGYAPGTLRATESVVLTEWDLGEMSLLHREDRESLEVRLSGVRLLGVRQGALLLDVDGWLDALVGGNLDDTRITGLALFDFQGEPWGMAVGYNKDYGGRSGVLSFRRDAIEFPTPAPLKTAARKLRQILEALEPSLRPDSLRIRSPGL